MRSELRHFLCEAYARMVHALRTRPKAGIQFLSMNPLVFPISCSDDIFLVFLIKNNDNVIKRQRYFIYLHNIDIDGYIDQIKNRKETKYIHCNWGWNGLHNGYFLSTALNAEENPAYDDGIVSTRSSNFRYKLKTATFIKLVI